MQLTDEMREYMKSEGLVCEVSKECGHECWHFPFMSSHDWVVCQADNYNNTGYPDVSVATTLGSPNWEPKRLFTMSCTSVHSEGEFYAQVGYMIDKIRNRLKKDKEEEKQNRQLEIRKAGKEWDC